MRRSVHALIALLLALAPAHAQEPVESSLLGAGPLPFRDRYILSLGFLALEPSSAEVLAPGAWEVDAVWTTANSWAVSALLEIELDARDQRQPIPPEQLERLTGESPDGGIVLADGEVSRTMLTLRRGFRRGVQVELAIPFLRITGGGLDGFIETFHDSLGLEQAGRLGAGKDGLFLFLDTPRIEFTEERSTPVELGDVVISAKYRFLDQRHKPLTLSAEAMVKLPTGASEPLSTSGKIDLGGQLLAARTLGSWSFHAALGLVHLGSSEQLGVSSQTLYSGMAAAERALGSRTSLVFQGSVSESPFSELDTSRIGERTVSFTTGIKRALGRKNVLSAGFTENLENFNNSADVNLHVGISWAIN